MKLKRPSTNTTIFLIAPLIGYFALAISGGNIFGTPLWYIVAASLLAPIGWFVHLHVNPVPGKGGNYWVDSTTGKPRGIALIWVALALSNTFTAWTRTLEPGLGEALRLVSTLAYFAGLIVYIIIIWRRFRGYGGGGGGDDDDPEPEPVEPPKTKQTV